MKNDHYQNSESKTNAPKTALIFLCYKDLREIEWIIPNISLYYDAYNIYVPFMEKSARNSMLREFLDTRNARLHTYTELIFISRFWSKITKIFPEIIHNKIFSLLERTSHKSYGRYFQKFLTKKIIHTLKTKPKIGVYFSLVFCKSNSPFKSSFFAELEKEKINFSAFTTNFWGEKPKILTINNVDYFCKAPSEHLGRMKPDLIQPFINFYSNSDHWAQIKQESRQRKIAVFFTKSLSALNYLYSYDVRLDYRQKILNELKQKGFFIVIKPHPGEKKIKNRFQNEYSIYSELPSVFLCKMADATIFELPTNSIFDAFLNNKNVYLPLDLLCDVTKKPIQKIIDEFPPFLQKAVKEDCFIHVPEISLKNYQNNRIKKYIS